MDVIKICGIVLAASAFVILLKGAGSTIHVAVAVGALILVCFMCLPKISEIINHSIEIANGSGVSEYIPIVLKVTAVALICELCSDICTSCDNATLGKIAVTAGKFEIIVIALPLFRALYDAALSLCNSV